MQPIYNPLRRHADGANKQRDVLFNDDVDELREFALAVVVIGLASVSADLWDEQVNAERRIWDVQFRFKLPDL